MLLEKKEFLSEQKELDLMVSIRESSPFWYIWPDFAILTFISRVVTEINLYL